MAEVAAEREVVVSQGQAPSLLVDINMAKSQGQSQSIDEGVVVSPPSAPAVNNYINGMSNGLNDNLQGQGQMTVMSSPPDTADTGYEFDPLSAELTNQHSLLDEISGSAPKIEDSAILIDLEAASSVSSHSSNGIHDASTASVTPQSPPPANQSQDAFDIFGSANQKAEEDVAMGDSVSVPVGDLLREGTLGEQTEKQEVSVNASGVSIEQVGDSATPSLILPAGGEVVNLAETTGFASEETGIPPSEKHVTFQAEAESSNDKPETKSLPPLSEPIEPKTVSTKIPSPQSPRESKIPKSPTSPSKIPISPKKSVKQDNTGSAQPPAKPPRMKEPGASSLRKPASPRTDSKPAKADGASDSGIEEDKISKKSTSDKTKAADVKPKSDTKKKKVPTATLR